MEKLYCEKQISWINKIYKKSYHVLNDNLKKIVNNKKFFVGSRDELGYYQPDLTDCLIDNNSRRGRLVEKSFIKKTYFEYWYANNDLIKIKYITDDYYDNYDVIIEKKDNITIYLFYSLDYNGEVTLSDFFVLEYENGNLIVLDKYVKQGILDKYSYLGAEYFYKEHKLYKAVTFDGFWTKTFDFEYDTSGKLLKCTLDDGHRIYNIDIKDKIEKFHKFGLYHLG